MNECMIKLILLFASLFLISTEVNAENFKLDPNHTFVLWHINHFGFSNPSGKWMANGMLSLDKEHPENSKVEALINVSDIITGIPELDKHLKGPQFFNTNEFPTAKFISDRVTPTGQYAAVVHGKLTVHGVTKPINLDVTLNKVGPSIITNKMTVGFSAHTKIKRSDFGMKTLVPGLSDEVSLDIEAEGILIEQNPNHVTP